MTSDTHKPKRQLATEIATAIRDGAYRSGEWLRQVDLEEKFNAKRFDVRTALAELALRKTVVHVANRGYRVAIPDINETHELLAIRVLLEVEAATLALPHIGPDAMREIRECAKAFERAISEGRIVEQSRTNDAFHDAIYRHGPNRKLVELVIEMRDRAIPGPITLWPSHELADAKRRGSPRILAALKRETARSWQKRFDAISPGPSRTMPGTPTTGRNRRRRGADAISAAWGSISQSSTRFVPTTAI